MWTNSHHLNLFYYVARHGGIESAARAMPYGIQRSAISEQIAELESFVGAKLFRRKPFSLTPAGRLLFRYIEGFFSRLPELVDILRNPDSPQIRIGVSDFVFHEYLPYVIDAARSRIPEVRFEVRGDPPRTLCDAVERGELDVAFVATAARPAGVNVIPITKLPIVLLMPTSGRGRSAFPCPDLRRPGRITLPLISPGEQSAICQVFQGELTRRNIVWTPTVAINSVPLVAWFVTRRRGFSVCFDLPALVRHRDVRVLPLPGFPRVDIVAVAKREAKPPVSILLEVIREQAAALRPVPDRPAEEPEPGTLAVKEEAEADRERDEPSPAAVWTMREEGIGE